MSGARPFRRSGPRPSTPGGDAGGRPVKGARRGRGGGRQAHQAGHPVSHLASRLLEVLDLALAGTEPADRVLRESFRASPGLGRRERGLVAETVFDILRRRRFYAHLAQSGSGSLGRRLALLSVQRRGLAGIPVDGSPVRMAAAGSGIVEEGAPVAAQIARLPGMSVLRPEPAELDWLAHVARLDPEALPPAVRWSLPDWLHASLLAERGEAALAALAPALLVAAPLDLRVNGQTASPAEVAAGLAADGIEVITEVGVPGALRVPGKPALDQTALFQAGAFEVQDAGSQVLAALLAPRRGQTLVDFCAGAGGKTLALAALLKGSGQVFACDVSWARLQRLRPRLARAGATNVQPMAVDGELDPRLDRLAGRADAVLVDAPCSGTGTLRRNPDLKWRTDEAEILRLQAQQQRILAAAARLVKPGGVLVYATCSLLAAENEAVVAAFEAAQGDHWRPDPIGPLLERLDITIGRRWAEGADPAGQRFLVLSPERDGCDGFFAARWVRGR